VTIGQPRRTSRLAPPDPREPRESRESRRSRAEPALHWRPASAITLTLTTVVGLASFLWPFLAGAEFASGRGQQAPWLFAALLGLLAAVLLGEITSHGLDAKTVAVLGVLAAIGGAMRVLSAGTAGLEPIFAVLVLGGRVLGRSMGFLLGCLALLAGAFLTAGIGPWLPFQMLGAGWVAMGAACLPRAGGRAELALLGAYGLGAGVLYGVVLNLWFWPFLSAATAPTGAGFTPGAPVGENLRHYLSFYVATSLGWDLPRAVLTAVLVVIAGPLVLRTLRRAVRRAAFDTPVRFADR
jgi:energy-coupling factor transport system substrate-specific component